ncbi:hypothetical protein V5F79_27355 [Xanthobacter flavus]|uniref:hypothetical protein n=1 Tax=Xanthobacter flavus TaxID=281 RepID=UPI00372B4DD8
MEIVRDTGDGRWVFARFCEASIEVRPTRESSLELYVPKLNDRWVPGKRDGT